MQKKLDEQSSDFQAVPGYVDGNAQAITSVFKAIHSQLKADKTYFAKLVSTVFLSTFLPFLIDASSAPFRYKKQAWIQHAAYDTGPLAIHVHCYMDPRYLKQANCELHNLLGGTTVAARIAFLRVRLHFQHQQGGHEASWEKSDEHLESLRLKSQNYRDDLCALVMELDQRLWNGKTTAHKTAHLEYGLPSDVVISAREASFAADQRGHGSTITHNGERDSGSLPGVSAVVLGQCCCFQAKREGLRIVWHYLPSKAATHVFINLKDTNIPASTVFVRFLG
ncbi:hypothetical protein VP01_644g2 [Puccinia sorghi]|uniref:Uncharacterized protein n=1 Tax=Puccinia sorghi TaxID=27349 RepID=A0A0L6UHW0_9BASI|nr:hypothetical protein VP01_644g2 [Puccinia sorghi]